MACTSDKAVQLRKESQNDHSKGKNDCPDSVDQAVEMMRNCRGTVVPQKFKKSSDNDNKNHNNNNTQNNEHHHKSVGFAQAVAGNDGKLHQNVKCYDCQKVGHCANHCPNPTGVMLEMKKQ